MAIIRKKLLKKSYKTWKVTRLGNMINFFLGKKQLDLNSSLKSNITLTDQ